ncbi:hypothetical protein [Chitinophaga rhizophila]|uniref:Long-chain fatty acid transport protein n=1 Tax=Chitinophaga rhizophila TaxID=2866212 RepID=A0ABS7GBN4_9BACT|nr:hypothetical protein [Chitinophaga rhizophila]MBW8684107.1 hypothetical protein [Chitinophaga rhizophila]
MKRIQYTTGLCGLMLLLGGKAMAQHGINSLYSAYAIGDQEEHDYTRNFGVGSSGIGRRSDNYLNELNPASYAALPRQHFMFDVSLRAQSVTYKDASTLNRQAGDVNIKRLAMGFKVNSRWGMSAGFGQFSNVDYKLISNKFIDTSPQTTTTEGSGGVYKAYISNGFRLNKNFAVGVSTNFLFGPNNVVENVGRDTVSTKTQRYAFSTMFNTGIQYAGRLGGDWVLGLGATYRFKTNLSYDKKLIVINTNETTLYEDNLPKEKYTLPEQYGAGIHLSNGTISWLADWRRQMWGETRSNTANYKLANSERISTGLEYTFRRMYGSQQIEGVVIQAGASYYKSYLVVNNNQIKDIAGTVGVSLPSKSNYLRYYIGVEVGQRGTTSGGLIRETYVNGVFHFSLRDIWFLRRTYD